MIGKFRRPAIAIKILALLLRVNKLGCSMTVGVCLTDRLNSKRLRLITCAIAGVWDKNLRVIIIRWHSAHIAVNFVKRIFCYNWAHNLLRVNKLGCSMAVGVCLTDRLDSKRLRLITCSIAGVWDIKFTSNNHKVTHTPEDLTPMVRLRPRFQRALPVNFFGVCLTKCLH